METFDVSDRNSWYFGSMSRQEATEVLMNERERGVFLVRDSNSIQGDYVLCVREDTKVSNYIINKILQQDQIVYRIGDQSFENLPKLLTFYTLHYLDTTPLRRPIPRKIEKVLAKFDFDGSDQDDLPFRRGEILTIVRKDEDQWWTAKNSLGQIGQIPVPYVQKYDENSKENTLERPGSGGSGCGTNSRSPRIPGGGGGGGVGVGGAGGVINNAGCGSNNGPLPSSATSSHHLGSALKKSDLNRKLPAYARVKQARVPNAYDKTALKLEVDDIIKVTKTNINGQWEGELKGKKGHFPFTHVEFIDNDGEMLLNKMLIAGGGGGGGSCIETNTTIVTNTTNTATNLRRGDDSTNPIANQTTTAAICTGTGTICSGGGGGGGVSSGGGGGTITNCNQTIGIKTNANDWGGE